MRLVVSIDHCIDEREGLSMTKKALASSNGCLFALLRSSMHMFPYKLVFSSITLLFLHREVSIPKPISIPFLPTSSCVFILSFIGWEKCCGWQRPGRRRLRRISERMKRVIRGKDKDRIIRGWVKME